MRALVGVALLAGLALAVPYEAAGLAAAFAAGMALRTRRRASRRSAVARRR